MFDVMFQSKLGAPLRTTLSEAVQNSHCNQVTPANDKQRALFAHIRDRLVGMLTYDQDLIAEMIEACDPDNGVDQYLYLKHKFVGATIAKTVSVIEGIVNMSFTSAIVNECRKIISANQTMVAPIPDVIVASLIISKLPRELTTMKTMLINGSSFPSLRELVDAIETNSAFVSTPAAQTFTMSTLTCINCGKIGHANRTCPEPRNVCSVCGVVGHNADHCLAKLDTPPPSWMSDAQKASLLERRAMYKRKTEKEQKESSSATTMTVNAPPSFQTFVARESKHGLIF